MNPIPIPWALQRMANGVNERIVEIVYATSGGAVVARTTWLNGQEFTTPLSLFLPLNGGETWVGWNLPKHGRHLDHSYERLSPEIRNTVTPEEHELILNMVSLL
jgi:hypothetical protein